jgi:hypothetical protein
MPWVADFAGHPKLMKNSVCILNRQGWEIKNEKFKIENVQW